jgi:DUF4097 and DUF4098 domain-containing protein YvlB
MNRTRIVQATLAAALCACFAMPAFAQQDIDKVNGGITAEAGQQYGDLETVNGSIKLGSGSRSDDVETVNGGISGGDDVQAGSLSTVNGGIRLGERARIGGDIETVNGGIFVDRGGQVGGDASTVTGSIGLVETRLAGSLETVSGDITVGVGSHVTGGVKVEKPDNKGFNFHFGKRRPPRIVIGPDAVVEGPLVFEREVTLYVHDSARTGRITGATAIRFSTPTPPDN